MTNDQVLDFIIDEFEGTKFVDHPDDRGGPTKFGITKKTLSGWRGRSVRTNDIHELTKKEAKAIYLDRYVVPVRGGDFQSGLLRLAVVDYAVHSGTRRAIKAIQEIVKTSPDGVMGPITFEAVKGYGENKLFTKLMAERFVFLAKLVSRDATQATFIYGWAKRLAMILERSA